MGAWGESPPSTSKILPFRRTKLVVQCTSAGQLTGQKIIDEVLLLKRRSSTRKSRRAISDKPQNLVKLLPWLHFTIFSGLLSCIANSRMN